MTQFSEGDQLQYVLMRTKAGKETVGKHPVTFVRQVGALQAIVRNSPNEPTNPEGEELVWLSRLHY